MMAQMTKVLESDEITNQVMINVVANSASAQVVSDIGESFEDDWCFPTVPVIAAEKKDWPH